MENATVTDFSIDAIINGKNKKPKFTYASLILLAIRNSPTQRLTLQEIYDYIKNNFPFYQSNEKTWQNCVRHILSTSRYFVQVERSPNDPGRGNYWTLSHEANNVVIGEDTGRLRHQPQNIGQMIPHLIPVPVFPEAYFIPGQPGMYPVQNPGIMPMPPYQYPNGAYIQMAHQWNARV